jgi:THO complex subunit 2
MAPTGKRKRNTGDPGENRPSPHRPQTTALGQYDRGAEMRDGGRRSSRGGQGGGRGGRRNDTRENPNKLNIAGNGRATNTPGPMSPPPARLSSATQTPIQTPTATADLPSPIPKRDPLPFDYMFLTDDRLASWEVNGRQEVVSIGIQARQDEDALDMASIVQELVRSTLDGRMDPAAAGLCVKEILGPDTVTEDDSSAFDPHTTFLDIFSMIYDAEESPMNPALRSFAVATGVSPQIMRQKLDGPFLQDLGLTRDTFLRVGVRQATNLLYRQANYNLLREETEGYSKLVTELFTTSASEPPYSEVVEDTFERVKGLIGTFDLDVGRVLDITLDVFAAVLIKHFRFFIKFLRVSSWWPRSVEIDGIAVSRCGGLPNWALPSSPGWMPEKEDEEIMRVQRLSRDKQFWERAQEVGLDAFFELGGRQLVDEETKKRIIGGKRDSDAELDAERQWIEATGTFPPSGNRVAAQLLGFKLRFYTSTARDKEDVLPANLIYLTALLIKIGFISLRDLYSHLWPLDEDMPAVRETKRKELEEKEKASRGGGASNALAMAGALPDDTLPNNGRSRETVTKPDPTVKITGDTDEKLKEDEPTDQKVQLLQCLLTIGAIPEALFILGRHPWLPEAYPELIDLINRILSHSIKDVYEMSRPQHTSEADCSTIKYPDMDQTGMPKGQVRLTQLPTKKQLRWPFPDKFDTNDNLSYRFYWDEWADNIPVCQNVDDIFTLFGTFLNLSGVSIGKDASLLSKLARIGAASLANNNKQENLDRWQDILKRVLVPALSLTKSNTSVVNEIYDLLRFYPVSIRYSIYAEWFEGSISRLPAMKIAFARAKYETERTMKRISLTNLTNMARTLAKTAYWCPGVVFRIALSQIEAYTNLTELFVECAKYFTDLGYDVLVWSLLSSLGGKDRNRNNAEFALLPSRWLLALSRFSGKVFRRYSIMDLSPIIQYVNDQLYRGNSTDLVILKELIAQMSGIVPDTDFNDAQLAAMTGGEALRKQTLINLQDKRYESTKTTKRLMRGLTESTLAGELLIGIAQHRQAAIYKIADQDAIIKMLATIIDDTQTILFQYLDLLRSNLSPEEFDKQVPSISQLLEDFGLDPALAFLIGRAGVAYRRSQISFPTQKGSKKSLPAATESSVVEPQVDSDGDTGMEGRDVSVKTSLDQSIALSSVVNGDNTSTEDVTMLDTKEESPSQPTLLERDPSPATDPYHDIMEPIISSIKKVLPDGSFRSLSPEFYAFFWTCSLSDLALPQASYDAEISRLAAREKEKLTIDRGESSRVVAALRKQDEEAKKASSEIREAILSEFRKSVISFGQKKGRLLKNKSSWFDKSVKADDMSVALLEKCLIPRLLLSPSDADYSFKMIKFLHDNGVPQFRTLSLYGHVFRANRLRSIIFTCTMREAENLGRFLKQALSDLARWHGDVVVYEKEAWGKNLPGFAKALDEDGKPKGFVAHDGNKGFKSILFHWHKNLNSALRDCLEGTEWMHIRNAINVLKCVVDVFPAVDFMGNNFIKQLNVITEREKAENNGREDLMLAANGVLVQLKKRSKKWVMVQGFGHVLVGSRTSE